jgi:hypothetical protein
VAAVRSELTLGVKSGVRPSSGSQVGSRSPGEGPPCGPHELLDRGVRISAYIVAHEQRGGVGGGDSTGGDGAALVVALSLAPLNPAAGPGAARGRTCVCAGAAGG